MRPGKRLSSMYLVVAAMCGAAMTDPTLQTNYPSKSKGGGFKANKRKSAKGKAVRR